MTILTAGSSYTARYAPSAGRGDACHTVTIEHAVFPLAEEGTFVVAAEFDEPTMSGRQLASLYITPDDAVILGVWLTVDQAVNGALAYYIQPRMIERAVS